MLLCDALSGYDETKKTLTEKAKFSEIRNPKGRVKRLVRPEVEILSMYSKLVLSGLKQFFLTPGSRSDLNAN
ncbi:P27 family phage terminase small subunit [Desulfobacterota bacterium AH_259_B03_O07]|nr:P27 family phage terminase small subunit [Desulfobacterota bacterium AH_259_B03_O07]